MNGLATPTDPRIYFAAERTLLAWLRSGLAVIGIGFLVARFGLFIALLRQPGAQVQPPVLSSLIGIGFVLLGAVMIGGSAWQHVRFCGGLEASQRPVRYWMSFSIAISLLVAALGLALGLYLLRSVSFG
jgi:putative membrane protein